VSVKIVLGGLWGDEGKGRVVYELARDADVVVRFNGGPNASHTVLVAGERFVLKQLPCGIFHQGVDCLVGDGMVLDLPALAEEAEDVQARGVDVAGLAVSPRAHLLLPWHVDIDRHLEEVLAERAVGTTMSGIGPAYVDKVQRVGLRLHELADRALLDDKLRTLAALHGRALGRELDPTPVREALLDAADRLRGAIERDIDARAAVAAGRRVLIEGAQGALLDLDHGSWPYVTASHPTTGGALAALGLPPGCITDVLVVVRAYSTRQSRGPLPTEIPLEEERAFRQATRDWAIRVGWLDLVALAASCERNGASGLIVTRLDSVAGLPSLRVGVAYDVDDARLTRFPSSPTVFARARAVTEDLGAVGEVSAALHLGDLPDGAKALLARIEETVGVPVVAASAAREGPLLQAAD
jgi:adenylosuccinate synthase